MDFFKKRVIAFLKSKEESTHSESTHTLEKLRTFKEKRPDDPIPLDITNAKTIKLPELKLEKELSPYEKVKQDWGVYWSIYNKGYSHYNRKWYQKAKEEFLKIYDWHHSSNAYFTHLLRTYRKLIDKLIEKKKYKEAFSEMLEMFDKCTNITNTDIRKYNKLVNLIKQIDPDFNISQKELIIDTEPEFTIDSNFIEYVSECKKPRGFKISYSDGISILRLKELSDFLPTSLPHIVFNGPKVEYTTLEKLPSLKHDVYRFRESTDRNAFIASSKDLSLYVYDWKLNLLYSFNASKYSEGHTHLRRVDLSSNLSHFLFTNVDKAYLLDSTLKIISSWEAPPKGGWEKRKRKPDSSFSDTKIQQYLSVLELNNNPTKEEIKSSFRRLAFRHHPDKNPDDPLAESKMKQIIEAYEYLTSDDAKNAFKGLEDEEYWVDTINTMKFEVAGMTFEIGLSIGSGEDWIYGSGISDDTSRIYLGCYSGKTYQVNKNGIVEKIYVIPEDKEGNYGQTNPVSYIIERKDYLHIMTYWYLYILKNDRVLKFLKVDTGNIKWFDCGFVHQLKNDIYVYLNNGDLLSSLHFKDSIRHICYKDSNLLIETSKKTFVFKLKINNKATNSV